jgi:3-methyladenine DNA glycosylase/8-oxoguanine DNA glycosylase
VEGVRAETIIRAASVADSLERLLTLSHEEVDRKLRTIPGIGVWTSAEARQRAAGDADAVSVGDYHLKNVVGWALAGKDRSTDEEMLVLLEPFKGHRHRATRLIGLSRGNGTGSVGSGGSKVGIARYGRGGPPRRGPRNSVRDYRSF